MVELRDRREFMVSEQMEVWDNTKIFKDVFDARENFEFKFLFQGYRCCSANWVEPVLTSKMARLLLLDSIQRQFN